MDESFDYIRTIIPETVTSFVVTAGSTSAPAGSTFDPLVHGTKVVISNGNLTASTSFDGIQVLARGSAAKNDGSGKWYAEVLIVISGDNGIPMNSIGIGVMDGTTTTSSALDTGTVANSYLMRGNDGFQFNTGFTSGGGTLPGTVATNVLQVAVDMTARKLWVGNNNVWAQGDPGTGVNPSATWASAYNLYYAVNLIHQQTDPSVTVQPTSGTQSFSPPAGFASWG